MTSTQVLTYCVYLPKILHSLWKFCSQFCESHVLGKGTAVTPWLYRQRTLHATCAYNTCCKCGVLLKYARLAIWDVWTKEILGVVTDQDGHGGRRGAVV